MYTIGFDFKDQLIQVYGINVVTMGLDQHINRSLGKYREIGSYQYPQNIKMPLVFVEGRHENTLFVLSKDNQLQAKDFASHYDPYLETQVLDLSHEADKPSETIGREEGVKKLVNKAHQLELNLSQCQVRTMKILER